MKRHSVPGNLTLRGGRLSQGYFARRIYPDHTSDMGLRDLPCQLNNLYCAVIFRSNKRGLFLMKQAPFIMWGSKAEIVRIMLELPDTLKKNCHIQLIAYAGLEHPPLRKFVGNSDSDEVYL